MHPVFIQAFYYGLVMVMSISFAGVLLRGFFWKYIKVRLSFGKYVMVKIRSPLRDHYAVGWVEEGFLVYKIKQEKEKYTLRLAISQDTKPFYRSLAVMWVDVDEERHAIAGTNYVGVCGFDAQKHSDLHTRALYRPSLESNKDKIMFYLIIASALIALGALYFAFQSYNSASLLRAELPKMLSDLAGTVVGTTTNV